MLHGYDQQPGEDAVFEQSDSEMMGHDSSSTGLTCNIHPLCAADPLQGPGPPQWEPQGWGDFKESEENPAADLEVMTSSQEALLLVWFSCGAAKLKYKSLNVFLFYIAPPHWGRVWSVLLDQLSDKNDKLWWWMSSPPPPRSWWWSRPSSARRCLDVWSVNLPQILSEV